MQCVHQLSPSSRTLWWPRSITPYRLPCKLRLWMLCTVLLALKFSRQMTHFKRCPTYSIWKPSIKWKNRKRYSRTNSSSINSSNYSNRNHLHLGRVNQWIKHLLVGYRTRNSVEVCKARKIRAVLVLRPMLRALWQASNPKLWQT